MTDSLTIVIPYFKRRYLEEALDSLAAQTRGGFRVFIGDDASPEDPRPLLEKYRGKLDIRYHRFSENMGGKSLPKHWDRCVRETGTEWVWLFSDDDVAMPGCVEDFCATLEATSGKFDVYRFNIEVIDGEGAHVHTHTPHPGRETAPELAVGLYSQGRIALAVEHIFRRAAFDEAGGFVDFPLAWFSDHASWLTFGRKNGFRTMGKGLVKWRRSGLNISSRDPAKFMEKLRAFRLYLCWLELNFPDPQFQAEIKVCLGKWFPNLVDYWGGPPGIGDGIRFWWFFSGFTGRPNLLLLRVFLGLAGFRGRFKKRRGQAAQGIP